MEQDVGRNRGALSLAIIGYLGVLASVISGANRYFILAFATIVFATYLLAVTKLLAYTMNLIRVRYSRTHYKTNLGHVDFMEPVGASLVRAQIYKGSSNFQRNRDAAEALMKMSGLRCEFRAISGNTIFCAENLQRINNLINADVPEAILTEDNGRKRLCNGPYIMKWKCDGRRRALSRRWVGFDETGYRIHPIRAFYYRWLKFKERLKDESLWPKD